MSTKVCCNAIMRLHCQVVLVDKLHTSIYTMPRMLVITEDWIVVKQCTITTCYGIFFRI